MNISLELHEEWLSLQKGFKWENIPMFSIITGVNGVGKSHLLYFLYNLNDYPYSGSIKESEGNIFNLILPEKITQGLNIQRQVERKSKIVKNYDGFIKYATSFTDREQQKFELEQSKDANYTLEKHYSKNLRIATDEREKISIIKDINFHKNEIKNIERQITLLDDKIYDLELDRIARHLGVKVEKLTLEQLKEHASHIYNGITEIEEFSIFLAQQEQIKNRLRIKYPQDGKYDELKKLEDEPKPHELINKLFEKYNFDYFSMINPYEEIIKENSTDLNVTKDRVVLKFKGKRGEIVDYKFLSSGEQLIVKLIIWSMVRDYNGNRINTIAIDEPDAHLHPKMCKMMIEILEEMSKPTEEGGNNLRIIITTHSPSTVAYAPKDSLFVMERDNEGNRTIRQTDNNEALRVLSDGFITLDEGLHILDSLGGKELTIFTEGNNIGYINKAFELLSPELMTKVDIVDNLKDRTGKNQLSTYYELFKRVPHSKNVLFIYDCDVTTKLEEENSTFYYILEKNINNSKVTSGIENMFNETLFTDNFYSKTPKNDGGVVTNLNKLKFEEHIIKNGTIADFKSFEKLIDKVKTILVK
ncbi:ATP-binding protein [Dysgonomonas sp. GY75]|uniref:AAA family ATPase n=1 Tax=Dysgonomonas sp. GY75 TaxID=2780419 RepID=UPI001883442F|nr:AAA family ATPase [Dysgonomonas sp. GY75]MBF0649093.1 ATP-binding protein [Dysgonomonas sp. GY75]